MGLTTPGTAAADAVDQAFLTSSSPTRSFLSARDVVIAKAREVGNEFDADMSPASVHEKLVFNSACIPRQAAIFMADAVQAYCPRHSAQFMEPPPM